MKRALVCILFILAVCSFAFGANNQRIYSIDDEIITDIRLIARMSGYPLPSSSGPWSGEELLDYLKELEEFGISEAVVEKYENTVNRINQDSKDRAFEIGLSASLETNIHANTSSTFQTRDNWIRDFNQSQPMFKFYEDNHIGENFYGYFELSLGVAMHQGEDKADKPQPQFGSKVFSSNIWLLGDNGMKELDFNFPKRALIAIGGDCFSFEIGRDRLEWGNGTTGNLLLGDQIQYHNMIKASAWADNFKYTYLISGFPHPQNYYNNYKADYLKNEEDTGILDLYGSQSDYLNGISAFIAHRLEWKLFNKVNLALSEGIMYMSKDNKIEISAFLPSALYHNNYTRSLTNSILGLEFDWAVKKGLNVYGQAVIDEFALPGEQMPGVGDEPAEPNGFGFLAGATYTMPAFDGFLSFNAEAAYTDPYLYLRDGDHQSEDVNEKERKALYDSGQEWRIQKLGTYGINYVVAVREMVAGAGSAYYDTQFLGYKYGGDAIVENINVSYDYKNIKASFNEFLMFHGTHDKWTIWTQVNNNYENKISPTTEHQTANQNDENAQTERNAVATTLVLGGSCSYGFDFGLTAFGQLDFVSIFNSGNKKGNHEFDLQFTLAATYNF